MLFQKKSFKDNVKVSKWKLSDGGSVGEAIPVRLVISLAAPFVMVALFLWFFSKQSVVSSRPSPPSPSTTVPAPPAAPAVPAALDKQAPAAALQIVPKPQTVATGIVETAGPTVNGNSKKEDSKKPVAVSKQQVAEEPPKEIARPTVVPSRKDKAASVPAKPVEVMPPVKPVKPVKIVEGRPRSPLEAKESKSKGAPSKTASQKEKKKKTKINKNETHPVAKAIAPPVLPAVTVPVSTPQSSTGTPTVAPVPAVTGTSTVAETQGTIPASTTPIEKKREAAPKKQAGGQSYALQVGSFQTKDDAQKLAFRLKERGHDAYIVVTEIAGKGTWHRVRLGHYADRALAQKEGESIANAEHLSFFITSE